MARGFKGFNRKLPQGKKVYIIKDGVLERSDLFSYLTSGLATVSGSSYFNYYDSYGKTYGTQTGTASVSINIDFVSSLVGKKGIIDYMLGASRNFSGNVKVNGTTIRTSSATGTPARYNFTISAVESGTRNISIYASSTYAGSGKTAFAGIQNLIVFV